MVYDILNSAISKYHYVIETQGDPRVTNWFMLSSPVPTVLLVLCYVIFSLKIGPALMKNRKPFEINNILIIYNAIHALLSMWMFYGGTVYAWFNHFSWRCQEVDLSTDDNSMKMMQLSYVFFLSRFLEFLDTIFFIMRKKFNQVSTLHLVHHSLVPIIVWIGTKFYPGGHYSFAGYINSFVHIFMYTYYMLSAMGPSVQKYLWWKKYLTKLQLAQFCLVIVHTVQTFISDCPVPKTFAYIILAQAVLFLGLFANFYRSNFVTKPHKKDKMEDISTNSINKSVQNGGSAKQNGVSVKQNGVYSKPEYLRKRPIHN